MRKTPSGIVPIIQIERRAREPLHRQIYNAYRTAIVAHSLRPKERVPSTRTLASELGISRIPVLNAYAQLLAEGYFETRKGAGTFVSDSLPESITVCKERTQQFAQVGSGPRPVARRGLLMTAERPPWARGFGAFGVHQPAFEHFPFQIWSSIVARHTRSPRLSAIHNIDALGTETFREAICT